MVLFVSALVFKLFEEPTNRRVRCATVSLCVARPWEHRDNPIPEAYDVSRFIPR